MSVATEIARIQTDRNTIRNKLIEFGLVESAANLDACATAVDGIVNQGAVSATVQEGDTYTIPKGYHNGAGTVSGVAGGGNYNLQSKTVTPTKQQQSVTPDSGYYGLSDVTVAAIPQAYQDVSSVTAAASDVLAGKVFVTATGAVTTGEMPNNGAVNQTLTPQQQTYNIPAGYHNGNGSVSISPESKAATPTKSQQTIVPTAGKVLTSVTVEAIPAQYVDTSSATATAAQILDGETAFVDGELVEGTMPNNGATALELDGMQTTSVSVPAGYTSGGTVTLTNSIETALAAI